MPWVRIDENALDHPKIGGLSDGAFRLWVQGLAYCQKFLTDGHINDVALKGLRAYSPKRRGNLMTAGLWELSETGIRVHDFLQWNDSREHVMAARQFARERMQRKRDGNSASVRANNNARDAERSRNVPSGVVLREGLASEGGAGETERIRRFVDRYQALHVEHVGVAYLGNPQKDYQAACELVAAFDDALLEAISVFGLCDADPFMASGTRTLTKLKSRASDYAQHLKARKLA